MQEISTHLKNKISSLLIMSCLIAGFNSFSQTNYTWIGVTSTAWADPTNWAPNGSPTAIDHVTIGSRTNNPSLSGNVTVFDFSITSATLSLNNDTLTITNSATFSGSTITSGSIQIPAGGSEIDLGTSIFNASITAVCEDVFFHGSTFNQFVNLTKAGPYDDMSSGGNIFNNDFTLTENSGELELQYNYDDYFNGNIIINSSNSYTLIVGLDYGSAYLAPEKTITAGSQGISGTLYLSKFIQQGNTPQNIVTIGSGQLIIYTGAIFNGDVILNTPELTVSGATFNATVNCIAPILYLYKSFFNSSTILSITGPYNNIGEGANNFHDLTINHLGTGLWIDATFYPDTFNGNITVNTPNGGIVKFGNFYYPNSNPASVFSGSSDQIISGSSNSFVVDNFQLNKPGGNLLINMAVEVKSFLNLQNGKIIVSSGNSINLDYTAALTGGSQTSFIDGALKETGFTNFTFPLGNANTSTYQPLSISAPGSGYGVFTAQYFNSAQTNGNATDGTVSNLSSCEYWTLSQNAGSNNVSVKIGWTPNSCNVTPTVSNMDVAVYNSSTNQWQGFGDVGTTGNQSSGTVTSNPLTTYGAITLANVPGSSTANRYTWTGITSGDWGTRTNWLPNGIPGSQDTAIVVNTGFNPVISGNTTVAEFSITNASLTLNGNALITTYSATFSGSTISIGSIQASGSQLDLGTTVFNASITAVCEDIFIHGSTFTVPIALTQTGANFDFSSGGNTFANATLSQTGDGYIVLEYNNDDYFNGNIVVNNTNTNSYGLNFGGGGSAYLAAGNTITIGSQGFISTLYLTKFIQQGNTAQNLTITGAGFLEIGGSSIFNGAVNFTAPILQSYATQFNGTVNFTAPQLYSLMSTYNAPATFNNTGIVYPNMYASGQNIFNSDITLNQLGTGLYTISYGGNTFKGNLTVNTPNNGQVALGVANFYGSGNQTISGSINNLPLTYLEWNNSGGNLLVNLNLEISTSLNLEAGMIIIGSGNVLKLDSACTVSNARPTSFVDGAVQKVGNSAFTFPIGHASTGDYHPLTISAPANATDAFIAQYFQTAQTNGNSTDPTISNLSTCEYWALNRTVGTDNVSVTLAWDQNSCNVTANDSNMRVAGWNGSTWKNLGGINPTGNQTVGSITSANPLTVYGALTLANNIPCDITASAGSNVSICSGGSTNLTASGGTGYSWSPATGLSSASIANPVADPTTTTTYTVTVSTSLTCSQTAAITVTVNPLPTVVANTTASAVCFGTSIILTGSGVQSYVWSGGVSDGVAFTPSASGTYTVTGTDANGCTASSAIAITVNPLPTVIANTSASSVCAGYSLTLNGSGAQSYVWTGGVNNGMSFVPSSSNTYSVTGTDANGCTGSSVVAIIVNPLPIVTASASSSALCYGQSVILSGGGALSYVWTGGATDGIAFSPSVTNTYTVTGTNTNGCFAMSTIAVVVNPAPVVIANASSTTICEGSPVTLTGGGAVTYNWSGRAVDGIPIIPSYTTTYTVTGTNSNGCSAASNVTITVNPVPVAVAGTNATICASTAVNITASGGTSYVWSPLTGLNNYLIAAPTASPLTTTTYTVSVSNGSCSSTSSVTITVNPSPVVSITVNPSITITPGGNPNTIYVGHGAQSLTLTAAVDANTSSYFWATEPGISCTNCLIATVSPTVTTTYAFTAVDGNGCNTLSSVTITVVTLGTACSNCSN